MIILATKYFSFQATLDSEIQLQIFEYFFLNRIFRKLYKEESFIIFYHQKVSDIELLIKVLKVFQFNKAPDYVVKQQIMHDFR